MPDLNGTLHLDMWRQYKERNSFFGRLRRAARELFSAPPLYGMEWGDPETVSPLAFIRDQYVLRYVNPEQAALEIGPGGGRWTRYLRDFHRLYVVDYHPELLQELKKNFNPPNMTFIQNNGADFPGIQDGSIDFLFSFGCFVHLDAQLIEAYLKNMERILKPSANVVIHYSDKTKILAQMNPAFSDNTPGRMRQMVVQSGFRVVEEDLTTMWHSSIIRFAK